MKYMGLTISSAEAYKITQMNAIKCDDFKRSIQVSLDPKNAEGYEEEN